MPRYNFRFNPARYPDVPIADWARMKAHNTDNGEPLPLDGELDSFEPEEDLDE